MTCIKARGVFRKTNEIGINLIQLKLKVYL